MLEIWYGIVMVILIALFYEYIQVQEFSSFLYWLRLVFVFIALFLSVVIAIRFLGWRK